MVAYRPVEPSAWVQIPAPALPTNLGIDYGPLILHGVNFGSHVRRDVGQNNDVRESKIEISEKRE